MKIIKVNNVILILLLASSIFYFLYEKGIIFTNFENISPQEAYTYCHDNNTVIIDVRTKKEIYTDGMIKYAIHIPLKDIPGKLHKLQPYKQKKILVYCRSGNRSFKASRILSNDGFTVYNLKGGILAWGNAHYPIHFYSH